MSRVRTIDIIYNMCKASFILDTSSSDMENNVKVSAESVNTEMDNDAYIYIYIYIMCISVDEFRHCITKLNNNKSMGEHVILNAYL